MKKYDAINYYLNSFDLISNEIIDAITGKKTKVKFCYDKNIPADVDRLKLFLKNLKY
jgi:hypothetical protein